MLVDDTLNRVGHVGLSIRRHEVCDRDNAGCGWQGDRCVRGQGRNDAKRKYRRCFHDFPYYIIILLSTIFSFGAPISTFGAFASR